LTVPLAVALNGIAPHHALHRGRIVPMMLTMPYDRYVRTVQFLWPRYDPMMPFLTRRPGVCRSWPPRGPGRAGRSTLIAARCCCVGVMTVSITAMFRSTGWGVRLDPAHRRVDWASIDPRAGGAGGT